MPKFFTASTFYDLYQPSYCQKRIWMLQNRPELAEDYGDFSEMLVRRGSLLEQRHLEELGAVAQPSYPYPDFKKGFQETLALLKAQSPIIYQGVLIDHKRKLLAIPDFIVFDPDNQCYKIREVKLAINLENHPEIALQLGLFRTIATEVLGYNPDTEVVTGDGNLAWYYPRSETEVLAAIEKIKELRILPEEPIEPVGWSKCNPCAFWRYCWESAKTQKDVSVVPYIDQGLSRKFYGMGYKSYDHLFEIGEEFLTDLKRPWGDREQRVGASNARKIKLQLDSLKSDQVIIQAFPSLPAPPGSRPIVMFDIENDIFDSDLGVKVYLWGCLLARENNQKDTSLIVAPAGVDGDRQGWFDFLDYAGRVFEEFGDIPFVHYAAHERTWVGKYIGRYGDPMGVGQRILDNLWDMYAYIEKNTFLPVHTYGLKSIEKFIGFKRSQEEYGGLWSLLAYDKALNASSPQEALKIIEDILIYNTEDLLASLAIYYWLEKFCPS